MASWEWLQGILHSDLRSVLPLGCKKEVGEYIWYLWKSHFFHSTSGKKRVCRTDCIISLNSLLSVMCWECFIKGVLQKLTAMAWATPLVGSREVLSCKARQATGDALCLLSERSNQERWQPLLTNQIYEVQKLPTIYFWENSILMIWLLSLDCSPWIDKESFVDEIQNLCPFCGNVCNNWQV